MSKEKIYTFGYTLFQDKVNINIEKLFETLKSFNITYLIDVRSIPYSKQYPECNADNLKEMGKKFKLPYGHTAELGARATRQQDVFSKASEIFFDEEIFPIAKSNRPDSTELFSNSVIVDFYKFIYDEYFLDGIKRIEKAYEQNYTLAIMCSEKRPLDCHRYFLISKTLEEKFGDWLEIEHISQNDKNQIITISNKDLNEKLKKEVLNKKEIKELKIKEVDFGKAKIDKYGGNNLEEQIFDFCYRYWNVLHGWKRI